MPYRICKTIEVQTGHMLSKSHGGCRAPHGHSRHIELVLEADQLDQNDMVCDFILLKKILQETLAAYDHATCMNTVDERYEQFKELFGEGVIGFENIDPTTEVITKRLFDKIKAKLSEQGGVQQNVRLKSLRVWETGTAWAEFSED